MSVHRLSCARVAGGAPVLVVVQFHARTAQQLPGRRAAARDAGARFSTAMRANTAAPAGAIWAASTRCPIGAHGRVDSLNLSLPPLATMMLRWEGHG